MTTLTDPKKAQLRSSLEADQTVGRNYHIALPGDKYGRLTVLKEAPKCGQKKRRVECICTCGKHTTVIVMSLRRGNTRSCGCLHDERIAALNRTHGESKRTPEYMSWRAMRERCYEVNHKNYATYGGRGITVCTRWESYEAFLEDVGRRPGPGYTLDRIGIDGNYEPSNVRWASRKEQARNTRHNHLLTVDGVTRTLAEWQDVTGIPQTRIRHRIRLGWTPKMCLSLTRYTKVNQRSKNPRYASAEV